MGNDEADLKELADLEELDRLEKLDAQTKLSEAHPYVASMVDHETDTGQTSYKKGPYTDEQLKTLESFGPLGGANPGPVSAIINRLLAKDAAVLAGGADIATMGGARKIPGFEKARAQMEAQHPGIYTAGQMAPYLASPGTAIERVAQGIAMPAVHAAATGEDPKQAAALGLLGSVGGEALAPVVGAGMSKAGGFFKNLAESEAARSIGLTKGAIKKLGKNVPIQEAERKAIGRTLLDEGLVSPIRSTETLGTRAVAQKAQAGQAIGDVMETLKRLGENTGLTAPEIADLVAKDPELTALVKQIGSQEGGAVSTIEQGLVRKGREAPGYTPGQSQVVDPHTGAVTQPEIPEQYPPVQFDELQQYKQEVGQNVAYPRRVETGQSVAPGTQGYQGAQSAYHTIKDIQEKAIEGASARHPAEVNYPEYLRNKERYGNLEEIERHFGDLNAAKQARNRIGLRPTIMAAGAENPLDAAVMAGGLSVAQRAVDPAAALMADKLSKVMGSPYREVWMQAIQRGPRAAAATDFILQQTDPEYRKLVTGDENETGYTKFFGIPEAQ